MNMKKIFTVFFLFYLCCNLLSFSQNISPGFIDGEIFVRLDNNAELILPTFQEGDVPSFLPGGWSELIDKYKVKALDKVFTKLRGSGLDKVYRIRFDEDDKVWDFIRDLELQYGIKYAEQVPAYETFLTPNDPLLSSQYSHTVINALQSWDIHLGGNVNVAIVDDAVKITHEDLAPNIWVNPNEIPGDGIDNDNNGYVDDINGWDAADDDNNPNPPLTAPEFEFTHGTHCAGIAGAASDNGKGVASIGFNNKIIAVKCTRDNSGNTNILDEPYKGVEYAIAAGADVISMSWGGAGSSQTIQDLFNFAHQQGIVLVAASGNDNTESVFYPAGYDNVIAVASTDQADEKSGFSNYGDWIDVSAPGSSILSTIASNDSSYGILSGTSMACPLVAGLCGLLKSYNLAATPDEIAACIINSADNIDNVNPQFIGKLGGGRINALAALQCINPNQAPRAAFSSDLQAGCVGLQVSFEDRSLGTVENRVWSFEGGSPASSNSATPTVVYDNPGFYSVQLIVNNAFGSDTIVQDSFIRIFDKGLPLPFSEDFESENWQSSGWQVDNPDNSITWERKAVSGTSPGSNAIGIDYYLYNSIGQRDAIISPLLDFSNYSDIELTFDHAYRRYNTISSDSLLVYVSTDCGSTYPFKLFAGGENGNGSFATASTSTTSFTPQNEDLWCSGPVGANCFALDLSQFAGEERVTIRFEGFNNYQNNLFLDNIQVNGRNADSDPEAEFEVSQVAGCIPLTVTFTDESIGADSVRWIFPGGTPESSAELNPQVTYDSEGNFDVSLIAYNAFGIDTMTKAGLITATACTPEVCDTLRNAIDAYNELFVVEPSAGSGYVCGHNSFLDKAKAEYYANTNDAKYVSALEVNFGFIQSAGPLSKVTFAVWDSDGAAAAPNTKLGSVDVLLSEISVNENFLVVFDSAVAVNGAFYVGFELEYQQDGSFEDIFAVNSSEVNAVVPGTAWEQWGDDSWVEFSSSSTWQTNLSMAIFPLLTDLLPVADFTADDTEVCAGTQIGFTSQTENVLSFSWAFEGAAPDSSVSVNDDVIYQNAGLFDVALQVTGNCAARKTIRRDDYIQVNASPELLFTNVEDDRCGKSNGSATAEISGGLEPYSITWNTNPEQNTLQATNLSFGNYIVSVSDANQCIAMDTVSIGDVAGPQAEIASWKEEECGLANGEATVSVSGGLAPYTYQWNTDPVQTDSTATNLSAGVYSVIVTDANACADTTEAFNLKGSPALILEATGKDVSCSLPNGEAYAIVNGGTSPIAFEWDTDPIVTDDTLRNISVGFYTVIGTDANGCSDTASVQIQADSLVAPVFTLGSSDQTSCDSLLLTPEISNETGPLDYLWSTGDSSNSIMVKQSGLYELTISNNQGCSNTIGVNATINSFPQPYPDLGPDTTVCESSFTIQSNFPDLFNTWSTGANSSTITINESGIYSVIVTHDNGCVATDSITVNFLSIPSLSLGNDTTICSPLTLTAGDGSDQYLWSTGAVTPEILVDSSGEYSVQISSSNGCIISDTISVEVSNLVDTGLPESITGCDSVKISATNNELIYEWPGSIIDSVFWVKTSEEITVRVRDQNNICELNQRIAVTINQSPVVDLGEDRIVCDSTVLEVLRGGLSYLWSTGDTTQSITVKASNFYQVQVEENACFGYDTVGIEIQASPLAQFTVDTTGLEAKFTNASENAASYQWDFGDGNFSVVTSPQHTYFDSGSYEVQLIANGECGADTLVQTVIIEADRSTSLGDEFFSAVKLFPVPARELLNYEFKLERPISLKLELINSLGQIVWERNYTRAANRLRGDIDIHSLPEGAYKFRYITDNGYDIRSVTIVH